MIVAAVAEKNIKKQRNIYKFLIERTSVYSLNSHFCICTTWSTMSLDVKHTWCCLTLHSDTSQVRNRDLSTRSASLHTADPSWMWSWRMVTSSLVGGRRHNTTHYSDCTPPSIHITCGTCVRSEGAAQSWHLLSNGEDNMWASGGRWWWGSFPKNYFISAWLKGRNIKSVFTVKNIIYHIHDQQ